ncbi:GTPase ObgE [Candidatus Saccharibacteria bacterium]|nr:GTPase ObgE [Candidatus Saccharibacteria bacterium]
MFVDVAKVSLKAGKGGDGAVSFRREIYIPKGGPDGGDGGKGGDIVFRADRDTDTLVDFRFTPILTAEDGRNGSGTRSAGRSGKDLVVEVPIGTVVRRDGEVIADLTTDGQTAVIAKGGSGGFGNAHFKSSTRQAPIIAEVGEPGEEFEAELELKSMADVGLVGLPNAGKSTFLSVVSNAKPEIADYPFTTITPNLGVATIDKHDLLIADIPGLIEGASEGKGLGYDFLRHVDRTAVLLHLVDVYNDDAGKAYQTIRKELEKYEELGTRPEIVALTKCEGVDSEIIEMQMASILSVNPNARIFTISSAAHQGLTELLRELYAEVSKSHSSEEFRSLARRGLAREPRGDGSERRSPRGVGLDNPELEIPTITLGKDALKTAWKVEKTDDDKFVVTGEKIEKFARRTDLNNYASVNRLRDIMKKMGIRGELTTLGAKPDSIISIAGKEFTLVEDW